jgi:ABC-type transport system involved in multi-copper enzyme maturation permease subunit
MIKSGAHVTASATATATDPRSLSWLPPLPVIGAKLLDLRRRRTLMTVTLTFTVGLPVIFFLIREILHLADPAQYGAAGTPGAFATVGTLMAEFGFIVAVVLGSTAATDDLTDGMFRHLVITGRSRMALYLARIPAGLLILLSLAAVGFTLACLATTFLIHPQDPGAAVPTAGEMVRVGLWLELYLTIGFTVSLGLGSLMGQRTVPVILLIVLEILLTPPLASHGLPHFVNVQRLIVGVAMTQMKPAALAGGTQIGGRGGHVGPGDLPLPPMPMWAMIAVIVGWIVGWLAIGAWKSSTRDA